MVDPNSITGAVPAFIAGLITSLHCVGMCGPLVCVLTPSAEDSGRAMGILTAYHVSRIAAYGVIGAILGFAGQRVLDSFNTSHLYLAPWLLVLFFVLLALRADRWLPKPAFLNRLFFGLNRRIRKLPREVSGSLLGLATPFLPCGPLYMVFGVALVMGSPLAGAEFLLAFGLGTLPLLFLIHSQYGRITRAISPVWMSRVQRGLALAMAIIITWRLAATAGGTGVDIGCPLCP